MEEQDPKQAATEARRTRGTEAILKQWLSLESVNANSKPFIANYDAAMGKASSLEFQPEKCCACDYVAKNTVEARFHERLDGHRFDGPVPF